MVLRTLLLPIVRCVKLRSSSYNMLPAAATTLINLNKYRQYSFNSLIRSSNKTLSTFKITDRNDTDNNSKSKLIGLLHFKSAEDALPFYKLPVSTLMRIHKTTKWDNTNGYCKNRLYYISDRIHCPPSILAERLAKRTFIYTLPFDWLESSLNVLLDMGVTGNRIVRDLWVLKYHHATIRERLQSVKDVGVDSLYPWMVRCTKAILNRSIRISQDTKNILGDSMSTHIYLANRLNISPEAVEDMCFRIPALKTIRVTKVKSFLDFLTKEGFQVEDIANKPRVITASQKTVKQRIEKLRKLGIKNINLNVLYRSRKDFNKFCKSIESVTDTDTD